MKWYLIKTEHKEFDCHIKREREKERELAKKKRNTRLWRMKLGKKEVNWSTK